MPTLQIEYKGESKRVEFTNKLSKGIYYVDESPLVNINCKAFGIGYDKGADTRVAHTITKDAKLSIVTLSGAGEQKQYFVFKSANEEDIDSRLAHLPADVKTAIKFSKFGL